MTHFRLIMLATAIVLIGGGLLLGGRVLSQQRAQLRALQERTERLEEQLAAQNRERDATTRELTLAERQLAELTDPTNTALSDAARAREAEIAGWLARVKRLKQLFEQRPDQRIPEMRLLTDDDWLRVGKRAGFDTEENIRKAFASARSAAMFRFASSLANASQKFSKATRGEPPVTVGSYVDAKASKGEPPATVFALAPYLDNPSNAEFLTHFEIIRPGSPAVRGAPGWAFQEKSPVDADYDDRSIVYAYGGIERVYALEAWIPDFKERSQRAYRDFSAANKGTGPAGFDQVIPYFNPPLDRAVAEKILKAERDRGWR